MLLYFYSEESQHGMMNISKQIKLRGRPRDPERQQRIIATASQLFLSQGFDRTSMDEVAKFSGTTKVTVYSYFSSKQILFEACVQSRTDAVLSLLSPIELSPLNPKRALKNIAEQFLVLLRDEQVLKMYRVLVSMANAVTPVSESMCRIYFEQGPQRLIKQVALFLADATVAGTLRVTDAERAAEEFFSLFHDLGYIGSLLGLKQPSLAQDKLLVVRNIDIFMLHYGT